ncbi:alpha/beta fold hydrolase [Kribbella capetownensis]|nr:alpha/beta hydrolase [Kribbella capetownensis]
MVTTQIATERITVDGLSIRYADSRTPGPDVLLLNPWPESLYAFEPIWAHLAREDHLVAVDLPGFGQSDSRADLMSPQAMAEFVVQLLDALQLDQVHLVAPDIGTSAALFAASAHPDRFHTVVVGSGAASIPFELGEPLASWVTAPNVDEYEHTDGRRIVAGTVERLTPAYPVPGPIRADYLESYSGRRFADSMRYVRAYPADLPVLRDLLPTIQTPVRIISGSRDTAVPSTNGHFLDDRLPSSTHDVVDSGHFVWEEASAIYSSLLTDWWRRH